MKRFLLLLSLVVLLFGAVTASAAEDIISVYLDGRLLTFDVEPCIIESRTMVPLRGIFETLGATVVWDGETRTIVATAPAKSLKFEIDNKEYLINFTPHTMDVPPQIVNSRTLVPLRVISESLDCSVEWHDEYRSVVIATPSWDRGDWTVPKPAHMKTEEDYFFESATAEDYNNYYDKIAAENPIIDYAAVTDSTATFYFDGAPVTFQNPVKVYEGRTLFPLAELFSLFGVTTTVTESGSLSGTSDQYFVLAYKDSYVLHSLGTDYELSYPTVELDGLLYGTTDVINYAFNYTTAWDEALGAVVIAPVPPIIPPKPTFDTVFYEKHSTVPDPSSLKSFSHVTISDDYAQYLYPIDEFTDELLNEYIELLLLYSFTAKLGRPGVYENDTLSVQLSTVTLDATYRQITITKRYAYNKYDGVTLIPYAAFPAVPDFGANLNFGLVSQTQNEGIIVYTYTVKIGQAEYLEEYRQMLIAAGFTFTSIDIFTSPVQNGRVYHVFLGQEEARVLIGISEQTAE